MYFKLLAAHASTLATELIGAIAAGTGNATIAFFDGATVATPATAPGATLLGTLTCSATPATQTDGLITFNAITQDSAADASGTATWARIYDGDGNGVFDVSVTNAAGDGPIKLNTTTIVVGGPILISSLTISLGG